MTPVLFKVNQQSGASSSGRFVCDVRQHLHSGHNASTLPPNANVASLLRPQFAQVSEALASRIALPGVGH